MDLYVYNLDEYMTDSKQEEIPFTEVTHSEIPEIDSFDSSQATVVIFEDLMNAIRENVNYISLHRGHGSLTDTKKIIHLYIEESESLAPVIDDLTLQCEFVVFDLTRSKSDPLSIQFSLYGQKAVAEAKKEAYGLSDKTLRGDFQDFLAKVQGKIVKTEIPKAENVKELFFRYKALKSNHSLDDEKIIEVKLSQLDLQARSIQALLKSK
ncbi:hypothetical protein C1646_776404 [Rhizophagus diaphanus]|nr:hypothetical protein C1646_776404 [Rhizophagus diaphanus] [Rhizophagus sp. MUCL 43196]